MKARERIGRKGRENERDRTIEKKKKIRVSKKRSWLREENGGMNVTDTGTFWTSIKIGWLRRALQGDSFIMETLNRDIQEVTHVRTSSIASLLAEKGTDHIAKVGKMLKNTFWQKALQHVTALAQGFYETNKVYVGEAIYWDTKWHGRNASPPNTSFLLKDRKTVMEVAMEDVGKEGLSESEKDHILHARTLINPNQAYDLSYPNHRGLTRALMWTKKGSNHWYKWLRAREEEEGLTRETEEKWNTALGRNVKISIPKILLSFNTLRSNKIFQIHNIRHLPCQMRKDFLLIGNTNFRNIRTDNIFITIFEHLFT